MTTIVLVLTTVPVGDIGYRVADALVDERLAACVSLCAPMTSVYWWRGTLTRDAERPPPPAAAVARRLRTLADGPPAVVAPLSHPRTAPPAHALDFLGVPARLRLHVGPADVREPGQPGPVQRQPADRLVAPALPPVDLTGGIADSVVGVCPPIRGGDRRVAYCHAGTRTRAR